MKRNVLTIAAVTLAVAVAGCAQKSDVDAVQSSQKEILAKLESMEKDQKTILAKVQAPPAAAAAANAPDPNKVYTIPVGDSAVRGPKNAPVTITMFSDFQCPFCGQAAPMVEEVLKAYPNDVNFIMKQFPLRQIHPNADPAARAAVAAAKQGKFWEMHDELYKNQRNLSPETMKGIAEKIGLDVAKWQADMDSDAVKKQVDAELALGQSVNVRGTPTLYINGKLAQNRSVDGLKAQVDQELKAKKG